MSKSKIAKAIAKKRGIPYTDKGFVTPRSWKDIAEIDWTGTPSLSNADKLEVIVAMTNKAKADLAEATAELSKVRADTKPPLWAEQAFIGATTMADTFAALHIIRALTAKWPILAALPQAYDWQVKHQKPVISFTGRG